MVEIGQWVDVMKKLPGFNYDSVEFLCEKIKGIVDQDDDFKTLSLPRPALVTSLRILESIVLPPTDSDTDLDGKG